MARPFPSDIVYPEGQLEIQNVKPKLFHAYFSPPAQALPPDIASPQSYKRLIFELNLSDKILIIYPYQVWGRYPMSGKYFNLGRISLDLLWYDDTYIPSVDNIAGFLYDVLPEVLIEDYNYGLGFRKNYRHIVSILERFEVKKLHISQNDLTQIDVKAKTALINRSDLAKMQKRIDNITMRAQKVSSSLKKDAVGELFFQFLSEIDFQYNSKNVTAELTNRIKKSNRLAPREATRKEQKDAIDYIRNNGKRMIQEQPSELIKLHNEIELVTLEELIRKFESLLIKNLPENYWQKLFDENPFILHMAFGIPVLTIQGQASVGGRKLSGSGEKIADYLVKNSISNNAAIVEIKTPTTKLISSSSYRKNVSGPSSELTGAVNQLLDQIYKIQKNIATIKDESRIYDLETYSVTGVLIIGRSMSDSDHQKSFELYRGNSKNITIITFDELLLKLKQLHQLLLREDKAITGKLGILDIAENEDLPF